MRGNALYFIGASPDFEAKASYVVTVEVDDPAVGGAIDAQATFTLDITDVNEAPTALSFANVVTQIDENVTVGTGIKVADVVVTDDALGSATLSLSGADSAFFELRGNALYFIGASPSFEAKVSYAVTVEADDPAVGSAIDAQATFTLNVTDVNEAPTALSFANTVTAIDENVTVGTGIKVADVVLTDDALGSVTLSLSGADSAAFELRGNALYFIGASPDFEVKGSYVVTVEVDDPAVGGAIDAQAAFTLDVTDVNEAPAALSFANVVTAIDENVTVGTGIKVADVVVTDDALGSVTLALSGADSSLFELRGSALYFIGASPDFETKASYAVAVEADDPAVGGPVDASATFTLNVTDVKAPSAVSFANTVTAIDENTMVGTGIKVADVVLTDDAIGSAALTLSGADAAFFELRGSALYFIGASPDFESKASYAVTVEADDPTVGGAIDAQATFTLGINDMNEAPTALSFANTVTLIDENTAVGGGIKVADVVVSDDALGSEMLSLSGADSAFFELRGNALYFIAASPDFEAKASYAVTVEADDPAVGGAIDAQATFALNVTDVNEAPSALSFANTVTAIDENVTVGTGIKVADVVVTDDALGSETLTLVGSRQSASSNCAAANSTSSARARISRRNRATPSRSKPTTRRSAARSTPRRPSRSASTTCSRTRCR